MTTDGSDQWSISFFRKEFKCVIFASLPVVNEQDASAILLYPLKIKTKPKKCDFYRRSN